MKFLDPGGTPDALLFPPGFWGSPGAGKGGEKGEKKEEKKGEKRGKGGKGGKRRKKRRREIRCGRGQAVKNKDSASSHSSCRIVLD